MLLGSYVILVVYFPYELVVEVPRIRQNPESIRFNIVPAKCKMGPSKILGTILGPSVPGFDSHMRIRMSDNQLLLKGCDRFSKLSNESHLDA